MLSQLSSCLDCSAPLDEGDSRLWATHTRWYFDGSACREFTWKGNRRNGNNFRCKDLCVAACINKTV